MNRRVALTAFLIAFLLFAGWLAYQWLGGDPAAQAQDGFREWLWTERRFDLLLQMVLIFAGVLSIAAILPVKGKEDE